MADALATERMTIPKRVLFDLVGYQPRTAEGARFHNSTTRTRVISAPARTSKSYSAAHELWWMCFPDYERGESGVWHPALSRVNWIVGPDYKTVKEFDYLWKLLLHKRHKVPFPYRIVTKANSPQQGNMRLLLDFGPSLDGEPVTTTIDVKSATNPESLQGEQVYACIYSEAAELEEKVETKYLSTRVRYKILPTTPKVKAEWVKRLIDAGDQDPSLQVEHFQFDGRCNPDYDWELFEIEKKKAASRTASGRAEDDASFAEQFLGLWVMAEEQVVPFRERSFGGAPAHVLDAVPEWCSGARTFVSCDYGYADASVAAFFAVGPGEQLCVLSEVYEEKQTVTDFVSAIQAKAAELRIKPDYYVGDPSKPEVAELLHRRGLPVWDREKNAMRDRAAGHLALVDALSVDALLEVPRLRVLSTEAGPGYGCPRGIRELKLLRRKRVDSRNEFAASGWSGADHFYDALRYGIQTRPKPYAPPKERGFADYLRQLQRRNRQRMAAPPPVHSLVGYAPSRYSEVRDA